MPSVLSLYPKGRRRGEGKGVVGRRTAAKFSGARQTNAERHGARQGKGRALPADRHGRSVTSAMAESRRTPFRRVLGVYRFRDDVTYITKRSPKPSKPPLSETPLSLSGRVSFERASIHARNGGRYRGLPVAGLSPPVTRYTARRTGVSPRYTVSELMSLH